MPTVTTPLPLQVGQGVPAFARPLPPQSGQTVSPVPGVPAGAWSPGAIGRGIAGAVGLPFDGRPPAQARVRRPAATAARSRPDGAYRRAGTAAAMAACRRGI